MVLTVSTLTLETISSSPHPFLLFLQSTQLVPWYAFDFQTSSSHGIQLNKGAHTVFVIIVTLLYNHYITVSEQCANTDGSNLKAVSKSTLMCTRLAVAVPSLYYSSLAHKRWTACIPSPPLPVAEIPTSLKTHKESKYAR